MTTVANKLTDRYTYADYLGWDDSVRGELIDGFFYDMTPGPSFRHQNVAGGVYSQLRRQLRGKSCRAFCAPADVLLLNEGRADDQGRNVVQPDVFILCDRSKLTPNLLRGAPDWVLEVLSPSTSRKDQVKKLALYELAGVREFWLLEPDSRVLTIYTLAAENRYGRPAVIEATGTTALTVLPELTVDWEEAFEE